MTKREVIHTWGELQSSWNLSTTIIFFFSQLPLNVFPVLFVFLFNELHSSWLLCLLEHRTKTLTPLATAVSTYLSGVTATLDTLRNFKIKGQMTKKLERLTSPLLQYKTRTANDLWFSYFPTEVWRATKEGKKIPQCITMRADLKVMPFHDTDPLCQRWMFLVWQ